MKPKITVFMAAYNAAQYISESIQSILSQSFKDFELLIVNDGSTDHTIEVIREFPDPRIRLIHNSINRGLVYTRNVALKEAKGEYIAVLDSDDIAMPERLENQYNFFIENPDFALCGGHGIVINSQGEKINDNRLYVPIVPEIIKMKLLFLNTFVNSTVMYKASVLRELNGYREFAPAEDYEFFIRIASKYPVANLDQVLVKYRDHQNNTSLKHETAARLNVAEIKRLQLNSMGILSGDKITETFYSLLKWDFRHNFTDYLSLLSQLRTANRAIKIYPVASFEKFLFDYWFLLIMTKKAKMNAISLLMNKRLFSWKYVGMRQLRKTIKLSLKGFGHLSS